MSSREETEHTDHMQVIQPNKILHGIYFSHTRLNSFFIEMDENLRAFQPREINSQLKKISKIAISAYLTTN